MILGAGAALGSRLHTNAELCGRIDRSPDWVVAKTGITQRHYIDMATGETASELALCAAQRALQGAQVSAVDIGMIVACTFSHDYLFPPLSAKLHHDLGCKGGQFYDVQANCSGFVSALVAVSDRMRADPSLRYALVVGVEVLSPFVLPDDAETAMFFSDGAGAVVLGPGGIVSSAFDADTSNYESVRCTPDGVMTMSGLATWQQAVKHLPGVIHKAVERAGWQVGDVDLVIFHQANLRLIEFLMARLELPMSKTFTNVATVGNTGAASLPIAIADAWPLHGKIVLAGIGAGFGFGLHALWRFHERTERSILFAPRSSGGDYAYQSPARRTMEHPGDLQL